MTTMTTMTTKDTMITKVKNKIKNKGIIVSDGCCVEYGDTLALDNVSFTVNEGKLVAVVGPNGGGKSTLFNAMTGLVPIANGSLKIKGLNPNKAKKKSIDFKIIKEALNQVGLIDKIDDNINQLSGGQLQRIFIARTLTQGADILLLDEAFSAVDVGAQEDLMEIINSIKLDGKTILIATHDINNIEEKFDEVLCLNRHCCAFGDSSKVLTEEVMEEMYGSHNQMFKNHTPGNHGSKNGD